MAPIYNALFCLSAIYKMAPLPRIAFFCLQIGPSACFGIMQSTKWPLTYSSLFWLNAICKMAPWPIIAQFALANYKMALWSMIAFVCLIQFTKGPLSLHQLVLTKCKLQNGLLDL